VAKPIVRRLSLLVWWSVSIDADVVAETLTR